MPTKLSRAEAQAIPARGITSARSSLDKKHYMLAVCVEDQKSSRNHGATKDEANFSETLIACNINLFVPVQSFLVFNPYNNRPKHSEVTLTAVANYIPLFFGALFR